MAKPVVQPVETFADRKSAGRRAAWFVLWVAAGTGAGSLLHGTLGGTTSTDMALGAMLGVVVGWGWLRWTSPK